MKNTPGLIIINLTNNRASNDMSGFIAEGLSVKSRFSIQAPLKFDNEISDVDEIVRVDTMNRTYITKEGKSRIDTILKKYNSEYVFFTSVYTSTATANCCLSFGKDVSITFRGLLVGPNSEIIGISSFNLTSSTLLDPDGEIDNLLKEGAQLVVFQITKKLGNK